MWWFTLILFGTGFVVLSMRTRPQVALGCVAIVSLLLPSWFCLPLFPSSDTFIGTAIDIKTAGCALSLVLYCFMPGRTFPLALVPTDFLVAALILVHLTANLNTANSGVMTLGQIYVEWYLPYVVGRVAIQSREDFLFLWPVVTLTAVTLATVAIIEAFSHENLVEWVFGPRPLEGTNRMAIRWGIRRAYGTCLHPIYFGAQQCLLMPWVLVGAQRALRKQVHALWVLSPLICVLGIACTASRGPLLVVALASVFTLFLEVKKLRWPVAIAASIATVLLVANASAVIRQLESWSGESQQRRTRSVVINETEKELTGTKSRILLLEVYGIALKRSGLLGFGTEAVSGFPVNVPVGPQELETLHQLRNIDNTYVLIALRFGYLGAGVFLLIFAASVGQLLWIRPFYEGSTIAHGCGYMAAILGGIACMLFTVWLPPDIGFPMMLTIGFSGGLFAAHSFHTLHREASSVPHYAAAYDKPDSAPRN